MANFEPEIQSKSFELPSKGYFYDKDNPLSNGTLEIRAMTAKDEDILTDQSLAKKGKTLDRLLKNVIVTPIDMDTMLLGDKAAAIVATRIIGYGQNYQFTYKDPSSGEKRKASVDLVNDLKDKEIPFEEFDRHQKEFDFQLPQTGYNVKFKLLRHKDNVDMRFERKKLQRDDGTEGNITLRLKHQIVEIEGDRDVSTIANFVDEFMLARDSRALREEVDRITPDIDLTIDVSTDDGEVEEVPIQIEPEFFFPSRTDT
jgi:hypothetical protein